jgi:hypothetical protein
VRKRGLQVSQDRDQWRVLLSTVMNLRVPQKTENFLTGPAILAHFASVGLCDLQPLCVLPISARQRGLLDERRDRPFSVALVSSVADLLFLPLRRRLTIVRESVRVTLRLSVYRQLVRLGDKPLETHDQYFYFPTELLRL